jgi:transmembrane sensor
VVETSEGEVWVTGTSFNVRLIAPAHPDTPLNLAPGQEGDIGSQGVGPARPFEAEAGTAWRRGQLVFFRTPLAEVIEELNRYRHGRIVIWGENLRTLPVTGVFDTRDPSAAISI